MSSNLKIVFAGTPEIAKCVLSKILACEFKVDLVLTQPDRPKGRGQKLTFSPVKDLAIANSIEILQPISFKQEPAVIDRIKELRPDIIIVVAYGLILPQKLLLIPKLGCVNIHVSLLPRHRGAAPIQRAVLAGDNITGVSIMQMDQGLDTGDILLQREINISPNDTSGSLHDKLANLGADLIVEYLHNYSKINKVAQSTEGITYASKIEKKEAQINWHEEASVIERKIRGFNPFPGCFTYLDQHLVKIWQARLSQESTKNIPGTIYTNKEQMLVSCGNNSTLIIDELQDAGKSRLSAKQYLSGHPALNRKQFKYIEDANG